MYDKPLVNLSWLELKPNTINGNQEELEKYYSRLKNDIYYGHIPESVFEQWIHAHHANDYTIKNYAWLDFNKISFESTFLNGFELRDLYVIREYDKYVAEVSQANTFLDFDKLNVIDLDCWKTKGTWRTPPIVLDINSLPRIPRHSDISSKHKYQLVEGHTRFGYLLSVFKMSEKEKVQMNVKHEVFLMKYNNRQIREINK